MRTKRIILTKEERDVLILACPRLCGQHFNNAEIGQRLGMSSTRVKTLIHQACNKLGARNRYEALYTAIKRGLIRLNDIHTLDEIADILSAFCPYMLRRVTHIMLEEIGNRNSIENGEKFIRIDRIQDNILTEREQDVIALVAQGLTNSEIADKLYISVSAVRTFIYRACNKLGAHNRASAVLLAMKRGEMNIGEMYSSRELLQILAPIGDESLDKIAQMLLNKVRPAPVSTI